MSKGGSYMLYVIGFILVLFPLLATKMLRGEIGDFNTKLLLSIGCVIVAIGKFNIARIKKQDGEDIKHDLIIGFGLIAIAIFNIVR